MCLLELKKEQQDKNRKNSAERFFFNKKRVLLCFLKQKNMFYFKKTFVLKQAHISRTIQL